MERSRETKVLLVGLSMAFLHILTSLHLFPTEAFALSGEELFRVSKCVKCHSVKSKNIPPLKKSLRKRKIRDLSGVGLKHSPEWLKKWLQKKVRNKRGKKHKVKWKGRKKDLEKLVRWLSTLKEEIPKEEIKKWYSELKKKYGIIKR